MPNTVRDGSLILVGGSEDKTEGKTILGMVARSLAQQETGDLLVMTLASHVPDEHSIVYRQAFHDLGLERVSILDIRTREEAYREENLEKLKSAGAVWFTGGDQLRIASQLGGTPLSTQLRRMYRSGITVGGTSAGAMAIPRTMLYAKHNILSHATLDLALSPGLGLIDHVIVDTHFSERNRLPRLISAVSQNPQNIGIGIDEDTGVIIRPDDKLHVVGRGAVFIVDGYGITYSSLCEEACEGVPSIFNVKIHKLSAGNVYDLLDLRPLTEEFHAANDIPGFAEAVPAKAIGKRALVAVEAHS